MNDGWDLVPGAWKDGNSEMGRRVEEMILRNPEWLIYSRQDPRYRCPYHWDESSEGPDGTNIECEFCHGFGCKTTFEIQPASIDRDRGNLLGNRKGDVHTEAGEIDIENLVCDFPKSVLPQLRDILFSCEWNIPTTSIQPGMFLKPTRLVDTYMILKINSYFERELVSFNCGVRLYPFDDLKMQELLRRLPHLRVKGRKEWKEVPNW